MTLPGNLCVGILEEDNPLKSYFRFKPLLISQEDGYIPFSSAEPFPESGCLRIVPDKNESGHFKARMRRIGRYALLDLRAHPSENDKIRPNKNYRLDPSENNAYIVYSDVVVEPPAGMLYEILDRAAPEDSAHMALTMPLPGTQRVLFRADGGLSPALWRAAPMEGVEGAVELSREDAAVLIENGAETRLGGFAEEETCVLLAAPGASLLESTPPQAQEAPPAPAETAAPPAQTRAAEAPRPRLNARAQAIALQTGLNPRRSRSLQEIIDDKWRRSRIDQLGHPIPAKPRACPWKAPWSAPWTPCAPHGGWRRRGQPWPKPWPIWTVCAPPCANAARPAPTKRRRAASTKSRRSACACSTKWAPWRPVAPTRANICCKTCAAKTRAALPRARKNWRLCARTSPPVKRAPRARARRWPRRNRPMQRRKRVSPPGR